MITKQITYPDLEIVSIDEARDHSRITDYDDDPDVQNKLDAAHNAVQQWLNRKLIATEMVGIEEVYSPEIVLPYPPIQSIVSVFAEDSNENEIEIPEDMYKFDDIIGSIRVKREYNDHKRFKIRYICGYEEDYVPNAVKHAINMTFATLFEMREDAIIGTQVNEVPVTARNIIKSYRVRSTK